MPAPLRQQHTMTSKQGGDAGPDCSGPVVRRLIRVVPEDDLAVRFTTRSGSEVTEDHSDLRSL